MKYIAGVVYLILLLNNFICSKFKFRPSNSLNLSELVVNELTKSITKKFTTIPFSIQFITDLCKNFESLSLRRVEMKIFERVKK